MQEEFLSENGEPQNMMYSEAMARLLTRKRPLMGAHLASLRKAAGLSQYELAKLLNEPQSNIAFWELGDKPPRSDVLPRLAKILGVRVETILNINGEKVMRVGGPAGKVRSVFEQVSKLPRRQQDKIVEVVSALVNQHQNAVHQ